ncbi:MAG: apolipoprotein N-acyltransferase [Rhodospirillales bacterium]|nr:apolipoprotein N-acyltransferase [Rhodospirillales bacterium]
MTAYGGIITAILSRRLYRCLLAVVLGVLAVAALPPFYIIPVLWLSFTGLAILIVTANKWYQAALEGWLFGLGWFAGGLYWIGYAFLVDADRYAALMPVAVIGISCGMALYTALSMVLFFHIRKRAGPCCAVLIPAFAGCWALGEWFRSWVVTGFPWNPLSSVWGFSPVMMQSVAWIGSLGLSFLTALVFVSPLLIWESGRLERLWASVKVLAICLILPLMWLGGNSRIDGASLLTHNDIVLRLVQPDIPQALKWHPKLRQEHVLKQMAMSKRTAGPLGAPTHVFWAETNVPYMIEPDSTIPAALAAAVPPKGALFFGAPRRDAAGKAYNSLFAINDNGKVAAVFDKFHLVPFGEYVPFRDYMPFEKLTAGRGDFTAGPGPATLHIDGLPPFAAIICYEVIFSGHVVDSTDRPSWILNITNDAWFGPSTGPRQHLVQVQLRAIEEGLPVVRVANTGISAVVDAYGRIRNRLELDQQGILDALLPIPIKPTFFAAYGQSASFLFALVILLGGLIVRARAKKIARARL